MLMHLLVVMQLKRLAFLGIFIAVLPWLAVRTIVALSEYGPLHWGVLRPGASEALKQSVTYSQWLFDALVFSVPAGGILGWFAKGRPSLVAPMAVAGYSSAFFAWELLSTQSIWNTVSSFLSPNHLLLVLLFGLSTLAFSRASQQYEATAA